MMTFTELVVTENESNASKHRVYTSNKSLLLPESK